MKIIIDISTLSVNMRKLIAKETSDVQALSELAKDEEWSVRRVVTENPNTTEEIFSELAKTKDIDQDYIVRAGVAINTKSPKILVKLATDEDVSVRALVAENINTPKEVLSELSKDVYVVVRRAVASNVNTPEGVLFKLLEDFDSLTVRCAMKNPNLSKEM